MNKPAPREGFVAVDDDEPMPAEVPAVEQWKEEWPVRVRLLYKKIRDARGNVIDHLDFREPTGGDLNRYGNPVRVNQEGDVIIDDRKMMQMMAVLSGTLQPFLEAMDPRDYCSCSYRLRVFFLPDTTSWLPAATN